MVNPRIVLSNLEILSVQPFGFKKIEEKIYFDNNVLEEYLYENGDKIPPGLFRVITLFNDIRFYEYTDIILLFSIFLTLKCTPNEGEVKLEYSELMNEDDPTIDINNFHEDMTRRLVHKVTTYNKVFRVLLEKDSWLQEHYNKQRLSDLWYQLNVEKDKIKKGLELELFMQVLLEIIDGVKIIDRRINNGDEEIDIVTTNHIADTFWISLQSPLLLFECKNWISNIGVKELRDFEGKLRNHNNLCRIGFFISVNGFSSECIEQLKRMGRQEHILVLIKGSDIEELITNELNIKPWLEKLISKSLV
jgi:hypothetical protein